MKQLNDNDREIRKGSILRTPSGEEAEVVGVGKGFANVEYNKDQVDVETLPLDKLTLIRQTRPPQTKQQQSKTERDGEGESK